MRATLLLCDSAEESGGKLYVLGGGWTGVAVPDAPVNMALAIVLAVPWDQTNQPHTVEAILVTDDGEQVQVNDREVKASGKLEIGRPPGAKPGADLNVPLALRFDALVLPEGGYRWELSVDGTQLEIAPFRVGQR